jgi:hypothetical protein
LDSPLATSSNASSEPSVNNNSYFADGIEIEDNEFGSERGNSSPSSHHGRWCILQAQDWGNFLCSKIIAQASVPMFISSSATIFKRHIFHQGAL